MYPLLLMASEESAQVWKDRYLALEKRFQELEAINQKLTLEVQELRESIRSAGMAFAAGFSIFGYNFGKNEQKNPIFADF